jgi:hypothetical protein
LYSGYKERRPRNARHKSEEERQYAISCQNENKPFGFYPAEERERTDLEAVIQRVSELSPSKEASSSKGKNKEKDKARPNAELDVFSTEKSSQDKKGKRRRKNTHNERKKR